MEPKEEYHDPDYPGAPAPVPEEPRTLSEEEKIDKIRSIVRREFSNELGARESEVMLIEQRMSTSRQMLHRLRYAIVNSYYNEQKLMLTNSQIDDDVSAQHEPTARAQVSSLLRKGQRRLHPSVRKLLGKQTVDLAEIFKTRAPRNKARKDYCAMVRNSNYTIAADGSKSLRPEKKEAAEAAEATMVAVPAEPSTSKPRKVPRHLEPKKENVVIIDEATRNQMKRRYRIIIGNTSKYAPPASRADRSTHKWLLYIRGPPEHPDPSPVLTHVVARLHHSYAPHHTVHVYKAPFHISRRGWGEFPARIELHFPLPKVNRPAVLDHTIKLDRNYTGLQTLGSETVVEVWLYSTPEMLPFEYTDPIPDPLGPPDPDSTIADLPHAADVSDVSACGVSSVSHATNMLLDNPIEPKPESIEYDSHDQSESWMEFFSKETTELDVDEMIIKPVKKEIVEKTEMECNIDLNYMTESKTEWPTSKEPEIEEKNTETKPAAALKRIMKYIDATTGKIYYLEMDRNLDLSKVQEIVINNTKAKISPIRSNGLKNFRKKKGGVSLLKPEVKNQLKGDTKENPRRSLSHIVNDHCYLGNSWLSQVKVKIEKSHYETLCESVNRLTSVKMAVNYLLKRIPVITDQARNPDYVKNFPFVVENEERYWRLDFAKRRNIEWSRAKLINRLIATHLNTSPWRTKQILIYSRLHGYLPVRPVAAHRQPETDEWSSWNDLENSRKFESNIKETFPTASDISSLTLFNTDEILNTTLESVEAASSDEEVDVTGCDFTRRVKPGAAEAEVLTVLPVESEEDRLRFLFVERVCADIGVELRNEDVGNGYSYSAVHAVILSAVKSFAEELVRAAGAQGEREPGPPRVWTSRSRQNTVLASHVYSAARSGRLAALSGACLATVPIDTSEPL